MNQCEGNYNLWFVTKQQKKKKEKEKKSWKCRITKGNERVSKTGEIERK